MENSHALITKSRTGRQKWLDPVNFICLVLCHFVHKLSRKGTKKEKISPYPKKTCDYLEHYVRLLGHWLYIYWATMLCLPLYNIVPELKGLTVQCTPQKYNKYSWLMISEWLADGEFHGIGEVVEKRWKYCRNSALDATSLQAVAWKLLVSTVTQWENVSVSHSRIQWCAGAGLQQPMRANCHVFKNCESWLVNIINN